MKLNVRTIGTGLPFAILQRHCRDNTWFSECATKHFK